jgi:ATP-dependent Clp protease ATP-binding subunit ClpA
VGKTELAKTLAQVVYGSERSFTRIDMSEFGEAHTVQRLLGAPPGYIGFESGGQLTNAVQERPYSLILLDEIEKANAKIFNIFLQVFDDGRLTDGRGQTAQFTNSILIATSNLGVAEIMDGFEDGQNLNSLEFISEKLMPVLLQRFNPEFLNRFDAIIVFEPLGTEELLKIAQLEIKKIEQRVAEHDIHFDISPEILRTKIIEVADPRMGARPIKRFVEQTCERLIAMKLLEEK